MTEFVVLVDENNRVLGEMEKIEAHEKALLHRAFSVFIFNSKNEMLLQQRALTKYHSPGLWTNTCCSHQRINETNLQAATRRLKEEMGMENIHLEEMFSFIYKAPFDNGLTEHELDFVLVGKSDILPEINKEEVADYKYLSLDFLEKDIKENLEKYTAWFKIIFDKFLLFQKK